MYRHTDSKSKTKSKTSVQGGIKTTPTKHHPASESQNNPNPLKTSILSDPLNQPTWVFLNVHGVGLALSTSPLSYLEKNDVCLESYELTDPPKVEDTRKKIKYTLLEWLLLILFPYLKFTTNAKMYANKKQKNIRLV